MFTTLRVFNTRVAKQGKIQNADAPASSAPMHPHMQFMPHSKNSSQGRMISMAQAWTRKATERQMTHGLRYHPLPGLHVRSLSTSRPTNGLAHGAWSVTPKAVGRSKNTKLELFQLSSWVMAAALPAGLLFSPSILNFPVDLILTFAVPFHAWYGCHHVVDDYVPEEYRPASNTLLYIITAVCVLGLLNLTFRGDGVTESIKSLWRDEKDKEKKEKK